MLTQLRTKTEKRLLTKVKNCKKELIRTEKNTTIEMKNTLEAINSRLDDTEKCIFNLEDKNSGNHPNNIYQQHYQSFLM